MPFEFFAPILEDPGIIGEVIDPIFGGGSGGFEFDPGSIIDPIFGGGNGGFDPGPIDPGFGGGGESVFDPSYGGTLPDPYGGGGESVFDPTYGGSLPNPGGSTGGGIKTRGLPKLPGVPGGGTTTPPDNGGFFGNIGKTLFGTGTGGKSNTPDWLTPLLGGAAAGYLLPKLLGGGLGGGASSVPVIQAPNYYDQFSKLTLPNYNPGPQPIVGMNPGYQMNSQQFYPQGPVVPR